MVFSPEDLLKLLLALLAGGALGIERELHHKAAGFRTIILISMGAALFTILDYRMQASGRIAANIVTGIGFLGAGVILHEEVRIKGLTTAAVVWLSAALGMGIGAGAYLLTAVATALVLIVMSIFYSFERKLEGRWDWRHYEIVLPCDSTKQNELDQALRSCGLHVSLGQRMKRGGMLVCTWDVSGSAKKHNQFVDMALNNPDVQELTW